MEKKTQGHGQSHMFFMCHLGVLDVLQTIKKRRKKGKEKLTVKRTLESIFVQ